MTKLTPTGYDYGGRPVYDVPPIAVKESAPNPGVATPYWLHYLSWECPNCGAELDYRETHDVYHEGYAPEAVPDQWSCDECDYTWQE